MAKILITYYSRTGHTANMAKAICDAAAGVEGAVVDLLAVDEVSVDALRNYDAVILGSPTYYGSMAAEIKRLLDDSVRLHGKLAGKVGGAFTSAANVGGGNETTIMDMLKALLIHGMVIQGRAGGDHYGPVAIGDLDERSRKQCAAWGRTIGTLAVKLHG